MVGSKSKQLSRQNVPSLCSDLEIASVTHDTSKRKFMTSCKASLKFARSFATSTSTAIFSIIAGFNAQLARADHLNFTLYNETSKSIYFLYVSAARDNKWGSDILDTDVLRSGQYTRITFPNQTADSPCIYDVKVVFKGGTNIVGRHNLCNTDSITVR